MKDEKPVFYPLPIFVVGGVSGVQGVTTPKEKKPKKDKGGE